MTIGGTYEVNVRDNMVLGIYCGNLIFEELGIRAEYHVFAFPNDIEEDAGITFNDLDELRFSDRVTSDLKTFLSNIIKVILDSNRVTSHYTYFWCEDENIADPFNSIVEQLAKEIK